MGGAYILRADCMYLSEKTHRLFESFQVKQKPETVKSYAAEIAQICSLFSCDFLDLTSKECEVYFEILNGKVSAGELKVSTVTRKMHQLSSFARFISLQGIGFLNPFSGIFLEEAKEEIPPASIVSFHDLDKVIGVLEDAGDFPTLFGVLFSVKLMLRMNEFRLLKFSSFSVDAKTNECFVRVSSENGDVRYVKVPFDLFEKLESYHQTREGFVVSRSGEKPEIARWLQRHLKDACLLAGVAPFNFQDLRNTGAYTAGKNGIEVLELSEQLGHKSERHIKRLENITVSPIAATNYVNIYLGDVRHVAG